MNFRPNEMISAHKSLFSADPMLFEERPFTATNSEASASEHGSPTTDQLMGLAKRVYAARSKRKDFLDSDLFGEPGWDMLVALYTAEAGGPRMTVSSLCSASQCPDTTALRWLDKLVQLDLIKRVKSPLDGRVFFVHLQPSARAAIDGYLRNLWNNLFAPY